MISALILKDEAILDSLIKHKIARPKLQNVYEIVIESQGKKFTFDVAVTVDDLFEKLIKNKEIKEVKKFNENIKSSEIKVRFEEFKNTFPSSDKINGFVRTRNMRTDPQSVSITRYKKLVYNHNLHPDAILQALKYEVDWRTKSSYVDNENKLKYMSGMSAWLNNPTNIKTQYEESLHDDSKSNDTVDSLFDEL
jgi:hypothetical protein